MKTNYKFVLASLITLSFQFGCKKDETSTDVTLDAIETGITSISELADDVENQSLAFHLNTQPKSPFVELLESLKISEAHAADCTGRAGGLDCTSGVKNLVYNNCTVPTTNQTISGYVNLQFSDTMDCFLTATDDEVIRTHDFTRTTPWGAVITSTSDAKSDYTNLSYGGGSTLTKLAGPNNNYELVILGKHRTRTTAGGRSALDLSIRTTTPIVMTNLIRSQRTINSGRLEVAHNLKEFTVAFEPSSPLTFSSNCCYPIGGTLNIEISGSINTTGQIEFNNSCDTATVTKNGVSSDVSLYSCE